MNCQLIHIKFHAKKSDAGLKLYYLISTNDMIGMLPDFCVQDFCIFALKMRWDED